VNWLFLKTKNHHNLYGVHLRERRITNNANSTIIWTQFSELLFHIKFKYDISQFKPTRSWVSWRVKNNIRVPKHKIISVYCFNKNTQNNTFLVLERKVMRFYTYNVRDVGFWEPKRRGRGLNLYGVTFEFQRLWEKQAGVWRIHR